MVKILQVVGKMNRAGMETLIMNIYRNIDKTKLQFDFCVHTSEEGDFDAEIKSLGGRIFHMPEATVQNFIKIGSAVEFFMRENNQYAAVHVHYSCVGLYYFRAAKKYDIKYRIYHAHNSSREKGMHAYLRYMMEQLSIKYANILFACSDKAAKYNFKNINRKWHMLNNGIDTDRFVYSLEKRNITRSKMHLENKRVCIHVGRFDIQKNHEFLIEIFNRVFQLDNTYVLLLLGSGPLKKKIQEKVKHLPCCNNVYFLGNVDNVENMLNAADLFLLPSIYEGLPLSLVEAETSGIKCIISDTITKEAVLVKENVYQVSINDGTAWVEKILENQIYSRVDKTSIIKEQGFDSKQIAKKMQKYYLKLGTNV